MNILLICEDLVDLVKMALCQKSVILSRCRVNISISFVIETNGKILLTSNSGSCCVRKLNKHQFEIAHLFALRMRARNNRIFQSKTFDNPQIPARFFEKNTLAHSVIR